MRKVKIVSDSCCDLSPELIAENDIGIIPLFVTLDESRTGLDGVDIYPSDIYESVAKTGKLPKTSAQNVAKFEEFFGSFSDGETDIIYIGIGSDLSSSYQNAMIAAKNMPNVYPVDSENLSTGIGLLVLKACDFRDAGMSAEEIVAKIEELRPKVRASFVVDSIDYLYKGGRCSSLAALGANLLKLKPLIEVVDGKMGAGKKYRGSVKDIFPKYVKERLENCGGKYDRTRVFITHSSLHDDYAHECVKVVEATGLFDKVHITHAGSTVSSHCGPDTLGVLFIVE